MRRASIIKKCTRCGASNQKVPFSPGRSKCLECYRIERRQYMEERRQAKETGEKPRREYKKYEKYNLSPLDQVAEECHRLGITYGKYRTMKMRGELR